MDISIIIVNYNTTSHLKKCLDSIIEFTKDVEFEIIVVDNNSVNRNIENFPNNYPAVKFLFRDVNDGFGGGCNHGALIAKGKYIAFINPDIIFSNNVLFEFKKFLDINLETAVCSGLLLNSEGEVSYSYNYFSNIKWEFAEALGKATRIIVKKLLSRDEVIKGIPFEIDWALGALIFLRKNVFEKVNGFDETFFLYCEDNDLQFRIKQNGYKIYCLPYIRVTHEYRGSVESHEGQFIYNLHMSRSKMLYFYKHFSFVKRNIIRLNYLWCNVLKIIILPFRLISISSKRDRLKILLRNFSIYASTKKSLYKFNYN
jgi:GT2 family glycosyltransferase